jgi:hypothetical protein
MFCLLLFCQEAVETVEQDTVLDLETHGKLHVLYGGTKVVQHTPPSKTGAGLKGMLLRNSVRVVCELSEKSKGVKTREPPLPPISFPPLSPSFLPLPFLSHSYLTPLPSLSHSPSLSVPCPSLPCPSLCSRGSGLQRLGKFLKSYVPVGEFWCVYCTKFHRALTVVLE